MTCLRGAVCVMPQVPAIWDDAAKATMRRAMADAGLVPDAVLGAQSSAKTGSPHPLLMVLEPEAASIYCQARCARAVAASNCSDATRVL